MTNKSKAIKQQMKLVDLESKLISADQWETMPNDVLDQAYLFGRYMSIGVSHDQELGWCIIGMTMCGNILAFCENEEKWNKL